MKLVTHENAGLFRAYNNAWEYVAISKEAEYDEALRNKKSLPRLFNDEFVEFHVEIMISKSATEGWWDEYIEFATPEDEMAFILKWG